MKIRVGARFEPIERIVNVLLDVPDDFLTWTERQQEAFLEQILLQKRTLEIEEIEWFKL